ncbi:MAG: rRNA maturation RNase YbeY [Candidatus Jorgensenbacteria bacterium]
MAQFAITCEEARFARGGASVKKALAGALKKLKHPNASFEVLFVSDATMGKVNAATRGKRGATNVLSFTAGGRFPRPDLGSGASYLGEIYLAPDCIARRDEHAESLAVHGLLHLLGYTHDGKRDTIEMEKIERELLKLGN